MVNKMSFSAERERKYSNLKESLNRPQLTELTDVSIPNGNRIFQLDMSDTIRTSDLIGVYIPLNHYGPTFLDVYRTKEEAGEIREGDFVVDSSQGNAALALTVIGSYLGFQPHAIVPEGHLPRRMLYLLEEAGAKLIYTERTDYINNFESKIRETIRKQRTHRGFLNHSMDSGRKNNETTLRALEPIATEILQQLREYGIERPDYFIGVWGNGSSLFGPGRILKDNGVEVVGWELFSQAVAYELAKPGEYTERYGIPITVPMKHPFTELTAIHGVPGSSYRGKGKPIDFPHIRNAITGTQRIITGKEGTRLIADSRMLKVYRDLVTSVPELRPRTDEYIQEAEKLPRLDEAMERFGITQDLGRTSVGNLMVALKLTEEVENKVIVTMIYDRLSQKYDTPYPK